MLGLESGGVHNPVAVYDDARIRERSHVIAVLRGANGHG